MCAPLTPPIATPLDVDIIKKMGIELGIELEWRLFC